MPAAQYTELDSRDVVSSFYLEYEGTRDAGWASIVGMTVDSDRETEDVVWLGGAPELRQWLGGRHVDSPDKKSFTVTNVPYEATMGLKKADLRRDKTGFLRLRAGDMGRKANEHWEVLLSAELEANNNGYDGQALYSSTHDESGSNQDNELASTEIAAANVADTAAPTADEAADIITQATGYFYTYNDDKGTPVNGGARQFNVMVGGTNQAAIYGAFKRAVSSDRLASGASNVVPNLDWSVNVFMNPRLTSTSDALVYFFISDSPIRSCLMMDEEPLTTMLLAEGSDWEFHNDEHLFGINATRTVAPGDWHKTARVTLS